MDRWNFAEKLLTYVPFKKQNTDKLIYISVFCPYRNRLLFFRLNFKAVFVFYQKPLAGLNVQVVPSLMLFVIPAKAFGIIVIHVLFIVIKQVIKFIRNFNQIVITKILVFIHNIKIAQHLSNFSKFEQRFCCKFKMAVISHVNFYGKKHFFLQKLSGGMPQKHLTTP